MSAKKETLFSEKLPEPETPWWRDDLKVVESAIRRARSNAAARRRLRSLLKTWAEEDEAFRREFGAELEALRKGKKGALPNPLWEDELLVATVAVWKDLYGGIGKALEHLAGEDGQEGPMFGGRFGTNTSSVKDRYYKAKKRLSKRK